MARIVSPCGCLCQAGASCRLVLDTPSGAAIGLRLSRGDGGCVDQPFRWCDNIGNVDPANFTLMSKAFANTVVQMAFDTKIMSASNDFVAKSKPKVTGGIARGSVAR